MSIELINVDRCNGCGICLTSCPMDSIRLDTLVPDHPTYPSCRFACPAHVDIRSYVYAIRIGLYDEALRILRESLPLPAVTGRICPHPCESECARREVDEATNINGLERFVADYGLGERPEPARRIYASPVAIVGSGPAGLSCAYFLVRLGYPVTVYEAMPVLGGMLRVGIPEFRLPRAVLDAEIGYIRALGVEFQTGVRIGEELTIEELTDQYPAAFLATGRSLSTRVELEGIDLAGVAWGLDFLREINLDGGTRVPERVVVIGGGNVAIDVALAARRLGARHVRVACLEGATEMPAHREEISQALEEGIEIDTGWGPLRVIGRDGKVSGIELVRCTAATDDAGALNPCFDAGVTTVLETDMVILAIGQSADLSPYSDTPSLTSQSGLTVKPATLETTLPGVFAGGDVVSGASSVVEAIAAGKRAAASIDKYLRGVSQDTREPIPDRVKKPPKEGVVRLSRQQGPTRAIRDRVGDFGEVKGGLDEDLARLESQRCMTCGSRAVISYADDCQMCLFCERDCPTEAIYVSPEKLVKPVMPWA